MRFPRAALTLDADRLTLAPALRQAPARGAIARLLGRRFTAEELWDEDRHGEHDRPLLALVRAYQVPALVRATFTMASSSELRPAVEHLLARRLPGIPWDTDGVSDGPFLKYLIVHASLPAPPDEATGQAMALE